MPGPPGDGVRVVGLDLGERRIGIAVSDRDGMLAVPHGTIERSGDADRDRATIARMVQDLEAGAVVVGLPLSLDGSLGPAAKAAQAEAAALAGVLGVAVELVDERLTTVTANRSLAAAGVQGRSRRRVVDQVAAAVLLQSWLDGQRDRPAVPSESRTERA
jgi:putative Holliday junction resolvase